MTTRIARDGNNIWISAHDNMQVQVQITDEGIEVEITSGNVVIGRCEARKE